MRPILTAGPWVASAIRWLLVAILVLATCFMIHSEANAQWQTKQYHARQATGTNTAQATVNVQNISPNDPDWKTEAIRVLNARQKDAVEAQKRAEDNALYQQTLQALGGITPYAQAASVAQSSAYGGNSIYGYTYSSIADYYNPADRGVLLNQYQNATNRSLDLADKASSNLKDLYVAEIGTQERTASIIAESQKIEALAKVLEASKTTHTQVQTNYQAQGAGLGPIPPPVPQSLGTSSTGIEILQNKCGTCHSGETPAEGITLDGSVPLSTRIVGLSFADIATGKMPKDAAQPLTKAEADAIEKALESLGPK